MHSSENFKDISDLEMTLGRRLNSPDPKTTLIPLPQDEVHAENQYENILTLAIGTTCPKCGGTQFSISLPDPDRERPDWPPGVLGISDCRSCNEVFLVKLAPELQKAFALIFNHNPALRNEVLRILFPH